VIYCLDTNVFIEAWNKYYPKDFFGDYWRKLDELAQAGEIFATEEVKREINKIDDTLTKWLSERDYFFRKIDDRVQNCIHRIFADSKHQRLVDSTKQRSIADPWVIAHAMAEDAVVVTKELFETNNTKRIKIPNVCKALGIEWIDDFEMIRRIGMKFKVL
jgi:predicted nucleic acid-binding protein